MVQGITMKSLIASSAALLALVLAAPVSAADRTGTVNSTTPFTWNGPVASGANVNYEGQEGEPCNKTPAGYCDTTLIHVDVPSGFYDRVSGGLDLSLTDYQPNEGSDFDLYVYKSDATGSKGELVASSARLPGLEESTTVNQASGYYLVHVVYWAVTASRYKGDARLSLRPKLPLDIDDPPGLEHFLASDPGLGFKSQSEPHLAQSPVNPNILIAGSKRYNRDRDSLKEYEFKIGTYISFDGGRTWSDLGQLDVCPADQAGPSTWPNNRCYPDEDPNRGGTSEEDVKSSQGEEDPDDPFDDRGTGDFGEEYITSDVWVDFDDEGNAYAMVLDAPPFAPRGNGWGMSFHRWETPSPEDVRSGNTWSNRIPINKYDTSQERAEFLDDKNTFAVNNAGPDRDGNPGIIIACWGQNIDSLIKQQTVCERSTDGGRTWPQRAGRDPNTILSDLQQLVIGVHVVADTRDPNTFYATWLEYAQTIAGAPGTYRFTRTTNGGQTWEPSRPIATVNDIPRTFPGQAFRNLSLPIMAVGPNSEIYVTYAEYLRAPNPGDLDGQQADIRIIKSTNGGQSFSSPKTVNQDATNADQFQQYIRVTPQGQVNVAYFDRRHDVARPFEGREFPGNFFIDTYLSRSNDGGQTFKDFRMSHDPWDPSINPPISTSGEFIGDYQGLISDDCGTIAFFNDTHLANDPARDPEHDAGMPRSQFQEVFAYTAPNTTDLGGTRNARCGPGLPGGAPPPGPGGAPPPGPPPEPPFLDTAAPEVTLRAPRYASDARSAGGGTAGALRLSWSGVDRGSGDAGSGIVNYTLEARELGPRGASRTSRSGPEATPWQPLAQATEATTFRFQGRPGRTYQFRVRALDRAGNLSRFSVATTMVPLDDRDRAVRFRGRGWRTFLSRFAYFGNFRSSVRRGDTYRLAYRGESVTLIGRRGPRGGKALVQFDRRRPRVIDFYSRTYVRRHPLLRFGAGPGRHVITVRVLGRKQRASRWTEVNLDGFAVGRRG